MFLTRLISGILLLLFTSTTIILGGDLLLLSLFVISIIGLFEFYSAMKFEKTPLAIIGYLCTAALYLRLSIEATYPKFFGLVGDWLLVLTAFILLLFVFVLAYPKYSVTQIFGAFFGIIYISVMLSFIFKTREMPFGKWIVWMIFIASWGSDTCAYVFGKLFGKRKLVPNLSPKKSVEGAIGGVLGSAIIAILFSIAMSELTTRSGNPIIFAITAGIGSLISQVGDLTASGIKRNFDIKDYGNLIPGHGGILDRYDSVIITAPIVYYLAYFIGRM